MTGGPAPDPGLQPERTRLAWRRTALAMTVVAGLTLRLALTTGTARGVLAMVALVGWVGLMILLRPWRADPAPRTPADPAPRTPADPAPRTPADPAPQTPARPAPAGASSRVLPLCALATVGYAGLGVLLVLATLG